MGLQKPQSAQPGIAPYIAFKSVPRARIDFHFVSNLLFFEQPLKVVGFSDRNRSIRIAMQDEHRTKPPHEQLHLARQAAEEFNHHAHATINRGVGKRKVAPSENPSSAIRSRSTPGCFSTKLIASYSVFIQTGKFRSAVALSANLVSVRSK